MGGEREREKGIFCFKDVTLMTTFTERFTPGAPQNNVVRSSKE